MSLLRTAIVSVLTLAVTQSVFAGGFDELNSAQQKIVLKGGEVMIRRPSTEGPWPSFHAYLAVNATPEETAAVFTDFNMQKEYFKNVTASQVVAQRGNVFQIRYTLNLPISDLLPGVNVQEKTLVEDVVTYQSATLSYRADWNLREGDYTEKSVGSVSFEPLGSGTLVVYRSFIVPKPLPGYLFWVNLKEEKYVARTEAGVRDTVVDLRAQTHKEVKSQRSVLDAQVSRLRGIFR